ncbi:MAG: DUF4307 domain-containing protein [Actinomycetota bacterium]|nr:DUF4307 domain-containing protein [Actinomycetota bacterium]
MSAPSFPAGRYGRRRSRRRWPRWATALLVGTVIAGTAALAVAAYRNQTGDVQSSVRGYVVSPASVRITFEVRRPPRRAVVCLLRARNVNGQEVGRAQVRLPPGPRSVTRTYRLPTRGRAVTGEVYGCTVLA